MLAPMTPAPMTMASYALGTSHPPAKNRGVYQRVGEILADLNSDFAVRGGQGRPGSRTETLGIEPETDVERQINDALEGQYGNEPFVRLLGEKGSPDTKNVTFTNFVDIGWRHDTRTGRVVLLSAEDNLVKGASGQAIQSLNLLCGWPETTGLL